MNTATIYGEATGKTAREEARRIQREGQLQASQQVDPRVEQFVGLQKPAPTNDAARQQVTVEWKQSTVTKEMMEALGKEVEQNINLAIVKAVAINPEKNYEEIVILLTKASTLRNIINTYGK